MTNAMSVFTAGDAGYHTYRIPALLTLPGGRVLAFAEARRDSGEDFGKIDVALRISDDGCAGFSSLRIIARNGKDTIGNPTPVYDAATGRIWLFLNTNLADGPEQDICLNRAPRGVGAVYSDDEGESWSDYQDMTGWLKRPGWTWYAAGPCHALQLANGRLLIPCNHGEFDEAAGVTTVYRPHVILSDDHGASWRLGGIVEDACGNENAVATLSDGRIYLNARSMNRRPSRIVAYSADGGETWADAHEDPNLPDSMCQGCVLGYPRPYDGCETPLLFSNNPHDTSDPRACGRYGLTVRLSLDDGASWPRRLCVDAGHTAYGDMAALPDGRVAILYERGDAHPYERIVLKTFRLGELRGD